ncbi:ribonuclease H-like domain-containing protein [bacterium]|nr:ribonuclease H-like domain-containing protein [bacterium]
MFFDDIKWKKYPLNQKKVEDFSFKNAIERDVVSFYMRRKKENILPFWDKDFPLYLEYEAVSHVVQAGEFVKEVLGDDSKVAVIYDRDLDGYGAMKLMALINSELSNSQNVFYKEFWGPIPLFTKDDAEKIISDGYEAVILLDMGQNSSEGLEALIKEGISTLVIDHHLQDYYEVPGVIYYNPNFHTGGYPSAAGMVYLLKRHLERTANPVFQNTYILLDVETTGMDPATDHIIEISALKVTGGEVVSRFNSLVHTDKQLSKEIVALTRIDNRLLKNKGKAPRALFPVLHGFIADHPVVAHNVNFDISFLNNHFKRFGLPVLTNEFIDTVNLSRKFFKGLSSYSLGNIVKSMNLYRGPFHRAKNDTKALYRLFLEILKKENNLRTFSRDEALLIYYITVCSDRMMIDGINYLFMKKIDNYIDFSKILRDTKYSAYLINSFYVYDKLIPVLNSKHRSGEMEEIDGFFRSKRLNIFKRKAFTEATPKKALEIGRELNPNGNVRVMLVDKKFESRKGAIAAQLAKNLDAPTVILIQDTPLYGSSRFLNGNILKFFEENPELFLTFGGHGKAVGFTIENVKIPSFIERFEEWFNGFEKQFEAESLFYDDFLPVEKVSKDHLHIVKMCGPFGKQMPPPTYLERNIILEDFRRYGKDGKSLFMEFGKNSQKYFGISLYNGSFGPRLERGKVYSILYTPMLKKYEDQPLIYVKDIEPRE